MIAIGAACVIAGVAVVAFITATMLDGGLPGSRKRYSKRAVRRINKSFAQKSYLSLDELIEVKNLLLTKRQDFTKDVLECYMQVGSTLRTNQGEDSKFGVSGFDRNIRSDDCWGITRAKLELDCRAYADRADRI